MRTVESPVAQEGTVATAAMAALTATAVPAAPEARAGKVKSEAMLRPASVASRALLVALAVSAAMAATVATYLAMVAMRGSVVLAEQEAGAATVAKARRALGHLAALGSAARVEAVPPAGLEEPVVGAATPDKP